MAKNNAKQILKLVGGKNNVENLVHCATRLRFTLKDESKADKAALEALPDVLSVVQSGGQYQVVIGPQVADYYDIIIGFNTFFIHLIFYKICILNCI